MNLVEKGINPLIFPGLKLSVSSDDSKMINFDESPKVILSASGMCEAGRIRHHLKHNLWRSDSTILFVGYQSEGTVGRKLVDGEPTVKLFGEEINVNARVEYIEGTEVDEAFLRAKEIVVTATYSNGVVEEISDWTYAGNGVISFVCNGETATATIELVPVADKVVSMTVRNTGCRQS